MLKKLNPLFKYTKGEKRGIAILFILIIIVLILRVFLPFWYHSSNTKQYSIEYYSSDTISEEKYISPTIKPNKTVSKEPINAYICCVDPNRSSFEELVQAGFSSFVATNILKYRQKGGVFKDISDLKLIYGIDTTQINKWGKVIKIEQLYMSNKTDQTVTEIIILDINTANAKELEELPSIGKVLSGRIIKYRELLGGYYSLNQLTEVYGITDSTLRIITPFIKVQNKCRKLDLTRLTATELLKHPYISRYQAGAIEKYVKMMGKPITMTGLQELNVFTSKEIERLVPYLMLKEYNLE